MTKQELIDFADFKDGDKVWISIIRSENGEERLIRRNAGFTPIELLGLASIATQDVIDRIRGIEKPAIITREVMKDAEK